MEQAHPRGNFHSGFNASHLLLSTNRFFWVNSKQPLSSGKKLRKMEQEQPVKISIWDLTRPIYYNCKPTSFSEWMVNNHKTRFLTNLRSYFLRAVFCPAKWPAPAVIVGRACVIRVFSRALVCGLLCHLVEALLSLVKCLFSLLLCRLSLLLAWWQRLELTLVSYLETVSP